jgi:hypothetical protein
LVLQVEATWEILGTLPGGVSVRSARVFDDKRLIGRIVDIGGCGYRADFVNRSGEPEEILMSDYYTALLRIAEEAAERYKRFH